MKTSVLLILFMLLLFLSGCSKAETNPPEPASAPASTPRTPPPSPAYVPEQVLECFHFWKDPDCFVPYICFDCDETKGSPLEHEWTAANYQEASVCLNCGEIGAEPLEPKFLSHGYRINTTAGRPFELKTITNPDPVVAVTGLATLLYIDIFESDPGFPAKTGYEYILSRFMVTFDDENALANGFQYMTGQLDYFVFDPEERAIIHEELRDSNIENFKIASRKLNYFGEEYEYYVKYSQVQSELIDETWYVVFEYVFLVPAGYDGIIVYVSSAATWTSASNRVLADNFNRDTLFFRLRAQTN